jgi:glucosamine-6-phosphate deaminase
VGDLDPAIWPNTDEPIRAVTRGIADIDETKVLILLAFGSAKAQAIKGALLDPISPDCPASFLREHANLHVFVDNEAAALL